MEKNQEANEKLGKINQIVSQTHTPGPKHNKIWARWVSDISSKSMFKRV
jgi:hypothetical protein